MNFADTSNNPSADRQSFLNDFKADLVISSPGRINLIGEHTDYNDGFALPTAIDKKIFFYFRENGTLNECSIYSKSYDTFLKADLTKIEVSEIEWENYLLGVLNELLERTDKLKGFDCIIDSRLPIGAGISSSAALECGLAYGLNSLFDLQLSKETLIILSRDAEHNFVGTKCGIMDQFAVMMSKEAHVILLDCKSLEHRLIPINISPYKILLLNTNVSHSLASSEYNTRREECETGVSTIKEKYPEVSSLRQVTQQMLDEFRSVMGETIYRRCQYVLNENNRVQEAARVLAKGDLNAFGELMYASHEGLQNEYSVSCPELDFLVAYSKTNKHILGSRMMGGGFGGCTINIMHQDAIDAYIKEVSVAYSQKFSIDLSPITVTPSGGTTAQIEGK